MGAEAGFLPTVGVSCADMKFGMVTVSDGKTKPQPVRNIVLTRFASNWRLTFFSSQWHLKPLVRFASMCVSIVLFSILFCQVRLQLTPDAFILQREELCFGSAPGALLEGHLDGRFDGPTGSDSDIHDTNSDDPDSRFYDQQVLFTTCQPSSSVAVLVLEIKV